MSFIWGTGRNLTNGAVRFVTRRTAFVIAVLVACGSCALALTAGVMIGRAWPKRDAAAQSGDSRVRRDYTIAELGKLNAAIEQMQPRLTRLASQVATLHDFETRLKTIKTLPRPVFASPVLSASDVLGDDVFVDGAGKKADRAQAAKGAGKAGGGKDHEAASEVRAKAGEDNDDNPASPGKPGETKNGKASDAAAITGEGGPSLPPRRCDELASERARDAVAIHQQIGCLVATLAALEQETTMHVANWESFPGRMPVDGARLGSPFGNRVDPFTHHLSFHPGVDLVAMAGTPILAAAGGRVIHAGPENGYGNAVEIDHGNGLITRYGHASRLDVQEGDLVLPRQHIADIGSTGRSTGPHLHFEVLVNGAPVDPADYLALFMEPSHG
ncbi:peptidoglycan DD-metalloendopeptidase family protein [Paraburkholderia sp. CNPSo 3157]|uniref:Peptidoglycan DD-metalloendopeptidase family protein n=1 Tax=Paraburkholderia franconis TaxID=2654983 RepID=A0A7X1TJ67_9BURK|nr:M23 family metallopeptidase [Paraburkholderia franconis]MPW20984.1 peptidoglycan DD-metalloendopeptidase family protein [Paraburkholderia franconis]